jgi:hypothetical protein
LPTGSFIIEKKSVMISGKRKWNKWINQFSLTQILYSSDIS